MNPIVRLTPVHQQTDYDDLAAMEDLHCRARCKAGRFDRNSATILRLMIVSPDTVDFLSTDSPSACKGAGAFCLKAAAPSVCDLQRGRQP